MNKLLCTLIVTCCISSLCAFRGDSIHAEIDLTWPIDDDSFHSNNSGPFSFTKKTSGTEKFGYWYANNDFCIGEHTGTHFDAPFHLNEKGWKVGEVPLYRLIANGVTIDLTAETEQLKENARLLPKHILQWERKHGKIPENSVILVKFGWAKHYGTQDYLNLDENNVRRFPGFSKEAAELIADLDTVVGVGVDTPSIEAGNTTDRIAHRVLSAKQLYILESLNIPFVFPETNFKLYVMPMRIKEGTGAPARVIADPRGHAWRDSELMNNSNVPYWSSLAVVMGLVLHLFI